MTREALHRRVRELSARTGVSEMSLMLAPLPVVAALAASIAEADRMRAVAEAAFAERVSS